MAMQYHTHHRTQQQVAMAFKIFILVVLVAGASAGIIAPTAYSAYPTSLIAAPIAKAVVTKTVDPDYDPNPQYTYAYDVQDSLTGDVKSQQESRNGDIVEGSYSLIEADGSRRIVDYTADPQNGFNAVIRKEAAKIATPVAYATPVAKIAAAPIAYAAPIAKVAAPAPATLLTQKVAAPLSYAAGPAVATAPLSYVAPIAHVSYSTPLFSYSH